MNVDSYNSIAATLSTEDPQFSCKSVLEISCAVKINGEKINQDAQCDADVNNSSKSSKGSNQKTI
jgi:hypothetical protein